MRPVTAIGAVLVLAIASPASAGQRWEVDLHGGYVVSGNPREGAGSLPGTNSASASVVPSWYFGDGAMLLNAALAFRRLNMAIAPLDPVLTSAPFERQSGGSVGIRFGWILTQRLTAEFALDEAFGALAATPAALAAIEASRASFVTAWSSMLTGPVLEQQSVTSLATIAEAGSRQRFATGALAIDLVGEGPLKPYAVIGAGYVTNGEGGLSVQLEGSYRFGLTVGLAVPPGFPLARPSFHETDTVTVRTSVENAFIGVLGGGLDYALTPRWGIRIDARDHIGRSRIATIVTATPSAERFPPVAGVLTIFTTPPLRFSTDPATPSTLGGAPVSGVTTFRGTGVRHQVKVTGGLFFRF